MATITAYPSCALVRPFLGLLFECVAALNGVVVWRAPACGVSRGGRRPSPSLAGKDPSRAASPFSSGGGVSSLLHASDPSFPFPIPATPGPPLFLFLSAHVERPAGIGTAASSDVRIAGVSRYTVHVCGRCGARRVCDECAQFATGTSSTRSFSKYVASGTNERLPVPWQWGRSPHANGTAMAS